MAGSPTRRFGAQLGIAGHFKGSSCVRDVTLAVKRLWAQKASQPKQFVGSRPGSQRRGPQGWGLCVMSARRELREASNNLLVKSGRP